ncbi:MAG: choice-of-anchor L domain-containing protein [Bacteroidia bacterium]|nr:choice-of-anchor L domain-containing protein [Bacteroidia bacterium]
MNYLPRFYKLILFAALIFIVPKAKAQLFVDTTATKEQLVDMLVDNGVYFENVSLSCPAGASGIFSHPVDQSHLSLKDGILLTTGKAINAMGPNNKTSLSKSNKVFIKDKDLSKLSDTTRSIVDRCILEFDITPVGNEISFNYIFGSEEYPEYVGSRYNDVFGFFVSGPGIDGPFERKAINIATVGENPEWPVAVNTIHSGKKKVYTGDPNKKLPDFSQYYVSNEIRNFRDSLKIQYDGFTTTLQAKVKVIPCKTYHFKLAIADLSDGSLDSGVFIEKNSFKSNTSYADKSLNLSCGDNCDASVKLNILEGKAEDYNIAWNFINDSTTKEGGLSQSGLCPGTNIVATIQPKTEACKQAINIQIPSPLSVDGFASGNTTAESCKGKINLKVSGGVPPYSYEWSNGKNERDLSNLCPGEYTVTVSDAANCQMASTFKLEGKKITKTDSTVKQIETRGLPTPSAKTPIKNGELIEFLDKNGTLIFGQNETAVKNEYFPYLGQLADLLKTNSKLTIKIVGHASSEGSSSYNMKLSTQRANDVKSRLIAAGASADQIVVEAKGENDLSTVEKSEKDRKKNRRVVISLKE